MSAAIQHCVVVVKNPEGLHMRPADKLVRTAASFQCQIELERAGQVADCRSILSLLTLAATQGSELILRAQGPDADQAVQAISQLFESQFDEPSAAPG
ncbi:HPr family phosphocarrier protein [Pirellulaceae bacterium SH467]|jgi:phosphotransferase system HPr (HPr) family protein